MKEKFILAVTDENACRRLTDAYITTMLLVFPLFTGFSGYINITFSKYIFFLSLTGIWFASLAAVSFACHRHGIKSNCTQYFALAYLAVCIISFALSDSMAESFLGAGRYDGLLSTIGYVTVFLGVSAFGKLESHHFAALGVSFGLCCVIAVFQICGINFLGLFPDDLTYYDGNELYSGVFLSTFGNTNILDDFLCMGIPAFFALFTQMEEKFSGLYLIPFTLGVFVVGFAGGHGAALALCAVSLIAAPLLFKDKKRLARGLAAAGAGFLVLAVSKALHADYSHRILRLYFSFGRLSAASASVGAVLLTAAAVLSLIPLNFSRQALRRFFTASAVVLPLAAAAVIYFREFSSGVLMELHNVMHGSAEDEYGSSRLMIWKACAGAWASRPVFGHGPGTLALHVDISFSRFIQQLGSERITYIDNAHNDYLAILVNTGIAGLLSYLIFLASCLRTWIKNNTPSAAFALGTFCFAFHSFFGLGLCISAPLFWLLLGLCCTEVRKKQEEQIEDCQ